MSALPPPPPPRRCQHRAGELLRERAGASSWRQEPGVKKAGGSLPLCFSGGVLLEDQPEAREESRCVKDSGGLMICREKGIEN